MVDEVAQVTPFKAVYEMFLTRVTDDMYMELTEAETEAMLQDLLIAGLPRFKLPRFNIFDYTLGKWVENEDSAEPATWVGGSFNAVLTPEEMNILAVNMMAEWFTQQLAITENTRMKYSNADFSFTSQANHMAKLKILITDCLADSNKLQHIYKRRKTVNGRIQSTIGDIMSTPDYGFRI